MRCQRLQLCVQRPFTGQITQPDSAAGDFILIGRADAAPGGANLAGTAHCLARRIHGLMQRQDQRRSIRNNQRLRGNLGPLLAQQGNLGNQMVRVDHNAITNDRQFARAHNARWQQRQLVFNTFDHQRMAGIMTALKTHNDIGAAGQPVNNLALALIAPLGPDYGYVRHMFIP